MNIDIVCFYWLNVCTVYWPLLVNFSKRSWLSFILVVNKWPTQSEQTQQCCHQHQPLMHRPIGQIHPHYRNVGRGWEWALRVSNLHTVPKPQCTVSEILSKLLNVRQELNIAPAKHQVPCQISVFSLWLLLFQLVTLRNKLHDEYCRSQCSTDICSFIDVR